MKSASDKGKKKRSSSEGDLGKEKDKAADASFETAWSQEAQDKPGSLPRSKWNAQYYNMAQDEEYGYGEGEEEEDEPDGTYEETSEESSDEDTEKVGKIRRSKEVNFDSFHPPDTF